jgi:hypothetical protein
MTAVELSDGGLWRKQVLRFDTIDYTDRNGVKRKLTFDRKYGEDLIRAFQAGAYPQVPFQIADSENRHNNDPRNTGGEVVALTLSRDGSGVDGFLRTWGDGTKVVEQNPKIGVSARILEGLETSDGRQFPRAIQHVLATVDPQIRDMHPWEKVGSVDLSNGTLSEALDLSTATYERGASMPDENKEGTTTLELSTAQAERLKKLLDNEEALEALAEELGPDFFKSLADDSEEDDSEDEGDEEKDEDQEVQLSGQFGEALELARAQLDTQGQQIVELTNQLAARRTQNEVNELMRRGLAPAVLELARPLLGVSPGAVELSNGVPGQSIDPGEVIREVLEAVIELSNSGHLLIDPDSETGTLAGSDKNKTRDAMLADWENYG